MSRLLRLFVAALTLAAAASPAAAQEASASRRTLVAINPIGAVFGHYAVNFERAIDGSQSVGLSASATEYGFEEDDYDGPRDARARSSLSAHYRYYPRSVFRGLSLDAQVGVARVEAGRDECLNEPPYGCTYVKEEGNSANFGFTIGWNWLLGSDDRLHIGIDGGARRHIMLGDEEIDGRRALAVATGRLSVGLRF